MVVCIFILILIDHFAIVNSGDPDQTSHFVAMDMGLLCEGLSVFQKRTVFGQHLYQQTIL